MTGCSSYREGVYILFNECDYEAALSIFSQLENDGYEKASGMIDETQYEWGMELALEKDYIGAYEMLLEIPYYQDTDEMIDLLTEAIYEEGQNAYWIKDDKTALEYFMTISSYENSNEYISLIRCRSPFSAWAKGYALLSTTEQINILRKWFYFEDAADIIVSSTDLACEFLLGNWRTSSGYYWNITTSSSDEYNYWCSYNLPWVSGNSFYIEDGIYYVTTSGGDKPCWGMTLITPDSMEMYCYSNGKTYTLTR